MACGAFKSDKYDWCPEGFFALKFTDPLARAVIEAYANHTDDRELADDLMTAIQDAERDFYAGVNDDASA